MSVGIIGIGPIHNIEKPRLVRPVWEIFQQRRQKACSRHTLRRLAEVAAHSYFYSDESGERFSFESAYTVGRSRIGFTMPGEQRIWFAHLLTGCVQKRLDNAVFKQNPLRVLPSSVRISTGMREQTKDPGDLERLAGQFAKRLMKIGNRQIFIVKVGTCLCGETRTDRLIAAVLKECASCGIGYHDWLPGFSSPAFSGACPEPALSDDALLER